MKILRWIADAPRFVEVNNKGKATGRAVEGMEARKLQHRLDSGFQLPRGWIRDWRVENGMVVNGTRFGPIGGRQHAYIGSTPKYRTITQEDVLRGRDWFERTWNGIAVWKPISRDYAWCSHVWSWMEWVEDEDAKVIFYSCYGEFADVTDLAIRDDYDPRTFIPLAG
jgi:hypothetical protein